MFKLFKLSVIKNNAMLTLNKYATQQELNHV